MGNKRALLNGELGDILKEHASTASRFVDLFCGSASVSKYIASEVAIPVVGVDLQEYSKVLAESVLLRTSTLSSQSRFDVWLEEARTLFSELVLFMGIAEILDSNKVASQKTVASFRKMALIAPDDCFITKHYGGHYFSLKQALALDALYQTLPKRNPHRSAALASILDTASKASSSPGHMAQPFQPSATLNKYISESWRVDVFQECEARLDRICGQHALVKGSGHTANALDYAEKIQDGDLVFCDPPYSEAQYSRFYHVLEGIAIGGWPSVHGAGRSPNIQERAASGFSRKTSSRLEMAELLAKLRKRACTVIITFPKEKTSNGLDAQTIKSIAEEQWEVKTHEVDFSHRTLGGSVLGRGGKRSVVECVIVLT